MTFSEAAMIMMSSGGGGGTTSDSLVKRLKEAPTLHRAEIADGWNIQIKVLNDDIDTMIGCKFSTSSYPIPGRLIDYQTYYSVYHCIYFNDVFKYAVLSRDYMPKYHEERRASSPDKPYNLITSSTKYDITSVASCKIVVMDSDYAWLGDETVLNIKRTSTGYYYDEQSGTTMPYEPHIFEETYNNVCPTYSGVAYQFPSPIFEDPSINNMLDTITELRAVCTKLM